MILLEKGLPLFFTRIRGLGTLGGGVWNTKRLLERERVREARRGTDATGNGNTTGEDPTHRGPTQRGGPRRGPTTEGEGHTGDPHRTHTN